jgi:metal-responsive CopG/Arc/MetJ family transcriptional regulator
MVSVITSISLPLDLLAKIDSARGNMSRSKFCHCMIEKGLERRGSEQ